MTLRGYPGLSPANTTEDRARVRSQMIPAAAGWRIVFSIYTNISTGWGFVFSIYISTGWTMAGSCCVLSTLASGPQNRPRMLATGAVSPAVRSGVATGAVPVSPQESVTAPVSPGSWCRHAARMPPHHLLLSFLSHSSHIQPWLELELALVSSS